MRVLSTARYLGEIKVPEGHKCALYALAQGDALKLGEESVVVQIDKAQAKRAEYLYRLRWVEGRTVAIFSLDGSEYAQPTKPDPLPKRKRSESAQVEAPPPEVRAPEVARSKPVPRSRDKRVIRFAF